MMFKYILTFVPRDCALSENIPQQASYNLKKLCHSVNKRTYLSHRNTHLFLSDNLYLSKAHGNFFLMNFLACLYHSVCALYI